MAIGFKHGSCGADLLNLKVENSQTEPVSPKENTIWVNGKYSMHRWDISPSQPCRVGKKNLIVYPYYESSHTEDGITFTDNGDGTVTANGTATAESNFRFSYTSAESGMFMLTPGTYTLSGCPSGGSTSKYALFISRINDSGSWELFKRDDGEGRTFTVDRDTYCCVLFRVYAGTTVAGLTVSPMLVKGSASAAFARGNATGQVWVKTDEKSTVSMNAIKKNGIIVKPRSVYEYTTNNGWLERNAEIYQCGAWTAFDPAWDGYFYKAGDECEDTTGGWTAEGWTSSAWSVLQLSAVNSDSLYVVGQASCMSAVGTVQEVDLSGINTLKASINQTAGTVTLCISGDKNHSNSVAAKQNTTTGACEVSLDVSGYNGSYYIILFAHGAGSEATIMNVWGE